MTERIKSPFFFAHSLGIFQGPTFRSNAEPAGRKETSEEPDLPPELLVRFRMLTELEQSQFNTGLKIMRGDLAKIVSDLLTPNRRDTPITPFLVALPSHFEQGAKDLLAALAQFEIGPIVQAHNARIATAQREGTKLQ